MVSEGQFWGLVALKIDVQAKFMLGHVKFWCAVYVVYFGGLKFCLEWYFFSHLAWHSKSYDCASWDSGHFPTKVVWRSLAISQGLVLCLGGVVGCGPRSPVVFRIRGMSVNLILFWIFPFLPGYGFESYSHLWLAVLDCSTNWVCIIINSLRTDGDFCHQGQDTEIAPKILKIFETYRHDMTFIGKLLRSTFISFLIHPFWGESVFSEKTSVLKATLFDAAISRLMTSVHSNLVQSRQYALLKTTSLHRQRTPWPWMPWRRNVDLLVPAGTSTRLDWIQCGFKGLTCCHTFGNGSWNWALCMKQQYLSILI
jgi:hypothetical protein